MPVTFDETVDTLKKTGLDVDLYRRGPDGSHVFSISLHKGRIYMFPGKVATFDVVADRKKRQAVLTVEEKARVITHTYKIVVWFPSGIKTIERLRTNQVNTVETTAEAQFPVQIPNAKYSVEILSLEEANAPYEGRYEIEVTVTARARKQKNCFLVGRDETTYFISLLPETVNSVDAAHKVLRPKGLRSNAVRQGEWFFEPVSKMIAAKLDEAFFDARSKSEAAVITLGWNRNGMRVPTGAISQPLEAGSSHRALVFTYEKQRYARGWVRDARKGHHEPLWLDGWHKIVRNRERIVRATSSDDNVRFQSNRFD